MCTYNISVQYMCKCVSVHELMCNVQCVCTSISMCIRTAPPQCMCTSTHAHTSIYITTSQFQIYTRISLHMHTLRCAASGCNGTASVCCATAAPAAPLSSPTVFGIAGVINKAAYCGMGLCRQTNTKASQARALFLFESHSFVGFVGWF
jgi:hypothetical protein